MEPIRNGHQGAGVLVVPFRTLSNGVPQESIGGGLNKGYWRSVDRAHTAHYLLKCLDREYGSLRAAVFARGVSRKNGRSSVSGLGSLRTAYVQHRFFPTASSFDHGRGFPTTGT